MPYNICGKVNVCDNEKKNDSKYPSAKVALEITKKEYAYEDERRKNFDTRSGFCMAFIATFFSMLLSNVEIEKFAYSKSLMFIQAIPYVMVFMFLGVSVVLLLVSMIFFLKVISTSDYKRINTDDLLKYIYMPVDEFEKGAIGFLNEILSFNNDVNNKKEKYFRYGLWSMIVAIFSSVISFILISIIKFATI